MKAVNQPWASPGPGSGVMPSARKGGISFTGFSPAGAMTTWVGLTVRLAPAGALLPPFRPRVPLLLVRLKKPTILSPSTSKLMSPWVQF